MRIDTESLPRRMFWAAAIAACVALLLIIVVQIWIQAARPENPTGAQQREFNQLYNWLSAIQTIGIQSIWASIALCLAGLGLNITRFDAARRTSGPSPSSPPVSTAAPVSPTATSGKIVIK